MLPMSWPTSSQTLPGAPGAAQDALVLTALKVAAWMAWSWTSAEAKLDKRELEYGRLRRHWLLHRGAVLGTALPDKTKPVEEKPPAARVDGSSMEVISAPIDPHRPSASGAGGKRQ